VLRHLLAPVSASCAAAVGVPRTLPEAAGVVLTFDDGPHPDGTPAVLELLARAGASAMFFMIGEQVVKRPALVREVKAAGHTVALHGYRHRLQARLPANALTDDTARGRAAIEDAIGEMPAWHRPPYGIYSPAGLKAARSAGLKPLLWSRWGKDWRKFTTPARIARRVQGARAGDVILLHDADFYSAKGSHERTAKALSLILAELGARQIGTVLAV
jgi:peptidoglycan-N-acetylglucosamine deacetylase